LIRVRLATLDDTSAITEIHKSHHTSWGEPDELGEPVRYENLTIYERWRQGGPWMSVESCAVHLNRLLAGSGMPLVAELDGKVLAEAEVYESFEPAPFGHHLNIAVLYTHSAHIGRGLGTALVQYIVEMARLMKCERITATHEQARDFYLKGGFRIARVGRQVRIPSQLGRVFYQAVELTDRSPSQINGWYMPLGRYQSARQEWEKMFPQDWAAGVPELLNAQVDHLKLTVTGQNAVLFFHEGSEPDRQSGDISLACWSARPLSNPLLTAIRDRAFRDGYPSILSFVLETDLPLLGNDAQKTEYTQDFFELSL
jgi:GNAT superfamily N-acetyltransferase